ncbi:hypothetical protein TcasGA2_TC003031 [Tribolium castaneum]|uniref:Uncharacterized protein n=1 Tax=Tribolium castaneum TaxID=7070 RepID=D6WG47_TRICA|nr:hypothetical protein TcasGA2_TC003031 [Tribolium castaneum]
MDKQFLSARWIVNKENTRPGQNYPFNDHTEPGLLNQSGKLLVLRIFRLAVNYEWVVGSAAAAAAMENVDCGGASKHVPVSTWSRRQRKKPVAVVRRGRRIQLRRLRVSQSQLGGGATGMNGRRRYGNYNTPRLH